MEFLLASWENEVATSLRAKKTTIFFMSDTRNGWRARNLDQKYMGNKDQLNPRSSPKICSKMAALNKFHHKMTEIISSKPNITKKQSF